MFLFRINVFDPNSVGTFQTNLSIQAADRHADPPVPAALTLDLPHQIQIRHMPPVTDRGPDFECLLIGFGCRIFFHCGDDNFDSVFPLMQIIFYFCANPAEHISALKDNFSVDTDFPDGIQRVDVQPDPRLFQKVRTYLETAGPSPVMIAYPLDRFFIEPDIRIGDNACVNKCGTVIPGDPGGDRLESGFSAR